MLEEQQEAKSKNPLAIAGIVVVAVYIVVSMFLLINARGRVEMLETQIKNQQDSTKEIQAKLHLTNQSLEQTAEALGSKVGMTQEELKKRTAELRRQQETDAAKLTQEQQKTAAAVQGVTGEVGVVKTDLTGAKTDIASTKSELEATKAKLEKTIGDLGVQSGLIAKNFSELDLLRHRGDRNYFDFTAKKNERLPVSTVSIVLKKTDSKKSKFTLNVIADDKTIEKKDRNANEPMQFYSGREKQLYELVVFTVDKDKVTGYLSTPKGQNQ
jgi:multidrug efflux pump subunit AcrA (membrane-fusion protein)